MSSDGDDCIDAERSASLARGAAEETGRVDGTESAGSKRDGECSTSCQSTVDDGCTTNRSHGKDSEANTPEAVQFR